MKYLPRRDRAPLKGATIHTSKGAEVVFKRSGRRLVELESGLGYCYSPNSLEELADGLRLLAADMREDAAR